MGSASTTLALLDASVVLATQLTLEALHVLVRHAWEVEYNISTNISNILKEYSGLKLMTKTHIENWKCESYKFLLKTNIRVDDMLRSNNFEIFKTIVYGQLHLPEPDRTDRVHLSSVHVAMLVCSAQ